jgi:RecJ-like exonuclease
MPRVLIQPGYTIQPKYLELKDGEQVCQTCHGTGKQVAIYGSPHFGGNTMTYCHDCDGDGKISYCAKCGRRKPNVTHVSAPWMDTLCLDCILVDSRFTLENGQTHE